LNARAATLADLPAILRLQLENLERDPDEARDQGFVTVVHDLRKLTQMHALAPSVIAEDEGQIVGYAIAMPVETRALIPVLEPMFQQLEKLSLGRFYVMGQICVAKSHRGRGVFDALYQGHRALYGKSFDRAVTEIATRNTRSMRAHERVGFQVIHRYRDETDDWAVVAWDFEQPKGHS
jgi:L-amino acid N-acyltransferase YncA